MSSKKTPEELKKHKDKSMAALNSYLDTLIENDSEKDSGKADKLSYWIADWVKFLAYEPEFTSKSLRKYKRGEIIKLHLGFNLGSEEGGLHYAVVLDKDNSIYNPVLTVVPLTSLKPTRDPNNLHKGEVFLSNELFNNMNTKLRAHSVFIENIKKYLLSELNSIGSILSEYKDITDFSDCDFPNRDFINRVNELKLAVQKAEDEELFIKKLKKEIGKMKQGSIALVSQITTVSKIRIYDPKSNNDILSGIKLSDGKLDMIDAELKRLYTKDKM